MQTPEKCKPPRNANIAAGENEKPFSSTVRPFARKAFLFDEQFIRRPEWNERSPFERSSRTSNGFRHKFEKVGSGESGMPKQSKWPTPASELKVFRDSG